MYEDFEDAELDAALESALDVPLEHLLAMDDFIEKLGGIEQARRALSELDEETQEAA